MLAVWQPNDWKFSKALCCSTSTSSLGRANRVFQAYPDHYADEIANVIAAARSSSQRLRLEHLKGNDPSSVIESVSVVALTILAS